MMSASTASVGVVGGRNKFSFTATQYQELEHQALIYKYMAAGIPIPSDLLFNIKRSLDSSLSSKLFPAFQSSPLGWNPYQMGYGKKIDPEPGRCRRTDGKKWRCAKEAYPDSKYCERHMHRGKNRSRKPVESPLTPTTINNTTSSTTTTTNNNNININNNCNSPISATSSSSTNLTNQSLFTNKNTTASLYSSYPSSDSSYNSTNPHLLYPHSSSPSFPHKDYTRERYYQGLKEDQGSEHAFFTETTDSSIRGFSIDESSQLGEKQSVNFPNYLQPLQNTTNNHQQQDKQCYIWGRDFNCELSMKVEEERSNLNEKTTHHFFDDLPITSNNKTNGGRGGLRDDSSSTTQLSISIPSSTSNHYDFFRNL